jgi:signal transduction histidine kinase
MVEVFETGAPRICGRVDRDQGELRGIREGLGIRSDISVPLEVAGERGGVLAAVSTAAEFFSDADLRFLTTVARWVGVVAHRAQLAEAASSQAMADGRRAAADELITVLAHDFGNFLTPLRGRLELLGRRAQRDGYDQYVRDAEELIRTARRLEQLVRELLDTARLEQGLFALNRAPVDLVHLVAMTVADFPPGAVELRTSQNDLIVSADAERVRQALENLLSNALKVQPADCPVIVEVAGRDEWATVSIADQGPGIPPEVLPRLFQRFGSGAGSPGLGLGLYLARGIANAHGGSLEADQTSGQGARFILKLHLEQP